MLADAPAPHTSIEILSKLNLRSLPIKSYLLKEHGEGLPLHIDVQPIVASLSLSTLYSVLIIRALEHPIG